jgi:uncharacterized protein YaiI (UPF0178 family)
MGMIWVDADAVPVAVREIICRAAIRTQTHTKFVANHRVPVAKSPFIQSMQVEAGFDVADNYIAQNAQSDDLVVTQDIPLAAEVMAKNTQAVNTRGEMYREDTIRQRLNMRDFMETMRSSGVQSGGPSAFSDREKQAFANALDRWLAKNT